MGEKELNWETSVPGKITHLYQQPSSLHPVFPGKITHLYQQTSSLHPPTSIQFLSEGTRGRVEEAKDETAIVARAFLQEERIWTGSKIS